MPIENVSDTAKWVALYRAMESERTDALFRDPYAHKLGGAEGRAILDSVKDGKRMAWAMITRTAVFDELILDAVRTRGVDAIVNLAAGLDARPWRMDLPRALKWYDVDLPGILEYKAGVLAGEPARCEYEAIHIDLRDVAARRTLFARIGAECRRALVVAEGLLVYLEPAEVGTLAADLSAQASFERWLIDLGNPLLLEIMNRSWKDDLAKAPFKFAPEEGPVFFRPFGWSEESFRSSLEEARRIKREMKGMWFYRLLGKLAPKERQEKFRRMSAFVVLANAHTR